jgi:MOSC domain-containing protein YiiM
MISASEIEAGMAHVAASPKDAGRIEAIFIRPESDQRKALQEAHLTSEGGVDGDRWSRSGTEEKPPDPRGQVSLMNVRVLDLIAPDKERWPLAGDNLIVDLDLGVENLPVGQRLTLGEVVLEVTEVPHPGCKKFLARYGKDALGYINAKERTDLRLRGVFAKVIEPGTVSVGDTIGKVE